MTQFETSQIQTRFNSEVCTQFRSRTKQWMLEI